MLIESGWPLSYKFHRIQFEISFFPKSESSNRAPKVRTPLTDPIRINTNECGHRHLNYNRADVEKRVEHAAAAPVQLPIGNNPCLD